MYTSKNFPWNKIHDFLIDVGDIRDPKELSEQVIQKVYKLIPYDQARVYFLNDIGKIYDEVMIGVEKKWSEVYLEYYSRLDSGRFSIPVMRYQHDADINEGHHLLPKLAGGLYDWTKYKGDNQFLTEYIKPQGLKYSAGFGLHKTENCIKSVYILDRTSGNGYSQEEIAIMSIIQPHLDNLHQNLFVLAQADSYIASPSIQESLTKRELEIANLLSSGLTPNNISHRLSITVSTVYRHIANIHKKLKVSTRQELVLKLIGT